MFQRPVALPTVQTPEAGIVTPQARGGPECVTELLEEYLTFLQHHRGLRDSTLYGHRRWGGRFLQHLAEHLPEHDLARLTIPLVDAFVLPLARTVGRGTQGQVVQEG